MQRFAVLTARDPIRAFRILRVLEEMTFIIFNYITYFVFWVKIQTGLHRKTSQGLHACFPKSIARQRGAGCLSLKYSLKRSLRYSLNLRHSLSLW